MSQYAHYIGVDPGLDGAVVVLSYKKEVVLCEATPILQVSRGRELNVSALTSLFLRYSATALVGIEQVGPFAGASSKSMFNFGGMFYCVQGICAALNMPYVMVPPKEWLKHFNLSKTSKEDSRLVAGRLYPYVPLPHKKDLNKAEALLIATYTLERYEDNRKRLAPRAIPN